ncbi:ATP-binding cassette sub-family B member 9, partial [Striga asiatica]
MENTPSQSLYILVSPNLNTIRIIRLGSIAQVPPRPEYIVKEIRETQNRQHPIEQIQSVLIQIESERVRTIGDSCQECLHASQRLLVEKLDQPDCSKHLRNPEYQKLRHSLVRLDCRLAPLILHKSRRDHGEGGQDKASANPVEWGQTRVMARDAAGKGYKEGVVQWDDEDEHEVRDGLEGGRGNVEGFGDAGLELSQYGVEHDCASEYGHDQDEYLDSLDLGHGAKCPRALSLVGRSLDTGLVQESMEKFDIELKLGSCFSEGVVGIWLLGGVVSIKHPRIGWTNLISLRNCSHNHLTEEK